jgi:hypothetical protein
MYILKKTFNQFRQIIGVEFYFYIITLAGTVEVVNLCITITNRIWNSRWIGIALNCVSYIFVHIPKIIHITSNLPSPEMNSMGWQLFIFKLMKYQDYSVINLTGHADGK